jgi:hypothetical protein
MLSSMGGILSVMRSDFGSSRPEQENGMRVPSSSFEANFKYFPVYYTGHRSHLCVALKMCAV